MGKYQFSRHLAGDVNLRGVVGGQLSRVFIPLPCAAFGLEQDQDRPRDILELICIVKIRSFVMFSGLPWLGKKSDVLGLGAVC